jgi:formate hydrogenlyase subunit 4
VTTAGAASLVVQVAGGLLVAPLLPGCVQQVKARLQGRQGAGPLQPYRELRRLWGKSVVAPTGTTAVYRSAPAIAAAALATAVLLVPVTAAAPDLGLGQDALVLAGLLALARFAMALAAWDTGSGFALQGAGRDLTMAVFVEGPMVLALGGAALVAGTTDLGRVAAATSVAGGWAEPALLLAAAAFAFVVIAETGRQPVDNPDTHLELTMIHEGPLLEYAGRDLAVLTWVAAARHWVVLILAAVIFLPHPDDPWLALALLPAVVGALCVALAVVETLVAKMRILRVPRMLAVATAIGLLGIGTHMAGLT